MILKVQGNEALQCELLLQGTASEAWAIDPMGKHFQVCPSNLTVPGSGDPRPFHLSLSTFLFLPLAVQPCTSLSTLCDAEKLL